MNTIDQTLATIRERIGQHQGRGISEEATKTALVNPLLRALGWDTEDLHQVYPEYSSVGGRVDYALLINDEPRLLIEAKALEANLDVLKPVTQLTTYAVTTGVRWTVLTNGDEYRIYNAYAQVSLEEKLFHTVKLSEREPQAVGILNLLSRSAVLKNHLDSHWQVEVETRRQQRVYQQLQTTLQALVDQDPPNESLVRLLRNQPNCELAPADIREGLRRTRVRFELPATPDTPTPPVDRVDPPPPKPQRQIKITSLVRNGIVEPPLDIHVEVNGRRYSAIMDAGGRVIFQGQRLRIVDAMNAARRVAAAASPERVSLPATVWQFWRFTDTDGEVKQLDVLRQRFLERRGTAPVRPSRSGKTRVTLENLIEAAVLMPPLSLHMTHRQQRFTARIEADGTIEFQGTSFRTPSGAGSAIRVQAGDSPEVNGWESWRFTDSDGTDQPLYVLRDRYLKQLAPEDS